MTDLNTTQPPIPLPPYMRDAQLWPGPMGMWLLYDAATKTAGTLQPTAAGPVWSLHCPVEESLFSRAMSKAMLDALSIAREAAKNH
jgi:hypothetical protein